MDQLTTGAAFSLISDAGVAVAGTITWADDGAVMVFTPSEPLVLDTGYVAHVGASARSVTSAPLVSPRFWEFRTVPHPSLRSSTPPDGARAVDPQVPLIVAFDGAMDERALQEGIHVSPGPAVGRVYTTYDLDSHVLTLSWQKAPRTEYCVTIDPNVSDVYGNALPPVDPLCFETGDFAPSFEPLNAAADTVTLDGNQPSAVAFLARNADTVQFSLDAISTGDLMAASVAPDARVRTWTQSFGTEPNATEQVTVSLAAGSLGTLPTGLYSLAWRFPGDEAYARRLGVAVINRHVTLKLASTEALVWVTDLRSGIPISRTAVQLIDGEGMLLAGGTTDGDGVARMLLTGPGGVPSRVAAAVVGAPGDEGFGVALSIWAGDAAPGSFGIDVASGMPPSYQVFVHTDRATYPVGDIVRYAGFAREAASGLSGVNDPQPSLVVTLRDAEGTSVASDLALVGETGTYSGSMRLPEGVPRGTYTLAVGLATDDAQVSAARQPLAETSLRVVPGPGPTYELVVSADRDEIVAGETTRFAIEAHADLGDDAAGVAVDWSVLTAPLGFTSDRTSERNQRVEWRWSGDATASAGRVVASGSGITDQDGRLTVEVPTQLGDGVGGPASQIWTLRASAHDPMGAVATTSGSVVVHGAGAYLGIHPDAWVYTARQRAGVDLAVVDWRGMGIPDVDVTVRLYQEAGAPAGGTAVTDTLVYEQRATTGAEGTARVAFTLPEGGVYVLKATSADESGRSMSVEARLGVGGASSSGAAWTPDVVTLTPTLGADIYHAGDVAELLIPVELDGPAQLLVTVEQDDVLSVQRYLLDQSNPIVEVPILAEYAPNAYISCVLVRPDTGAAPAAVQVGFVNVPVVIDDRLLNVDLRSEGTPYAESPRTYLEIHVTDAQGLPVVSSLDVIVGGGSYASGPGGDSVLVDAIYGERPLRVWTGDALLVAARMDDQRMTHAGQTGSVAAVPASSAAPVLWAAGVRTGADGIARIAVDLPQSALSWTVQAWAMAPDGRVGESVTSLVISQPLLVQPMGPGFAVAGDRMELAALVYNTTGQSLSAVVGLQPVVGLQVLSDLQATVVIPPGEHRRVSWTCLVEDVAGASLDPRFTAQSGALEFAAHLSSGASGATGLPVYHLERRDDEHFSGMVGAQDVYLSTVTVRPDAATLTTLSLEVHPSLASLLVDVGSVLSPDVLPRTVDGWVSRLLRVLAAYDTLQRRAPDDPMLSSYHEAVAMSLLELYGAQQGDGGWAWRGGPSKIQPSAYAAYGLLRAREAGFAVSDTCVESALAFLGDGISADLASGQVSQSLALGLFALSVGGESWPQGTGAVLYTNRDALGIAGRAYLAMALGTVDPSDTRLATLLQELRAAATTVGGGAHWDDLDQASAVTSVQSTSAALAALIRFSPADADIDDEPTEDTLIPDAVSWLLANRGVDGWGTDYETAWAVSALQLYEDTGQGVVPSLLASDDAATDWRVLVNDKQIASGADDLAGGAGAPGVTLGRMSGSDVALRQGLNILRIFGGSGPGMLLYAGRVDTMEPLTAAASGEDRGIAVERRYCLVQDRISDLPDSSGMVASASDACVPASTVRQGQLVEVQLVVTVPESRYFVTVTDPHPAGLVDAEGILEHAQTLAADDVDAWHGPFESVFYFDELPAGVVRMTYMLRVSTPGQYWALPTIAQESFFPEVWGRSSAFSMTVLPQH